MQYKFRGRCYQHERRKAYVTCEVSTLICNLPVWLQIYVCLKQFVCNGRHIYELSFIIDLYHLNILKNIHGKMKLLRIDNSINMYQYQYKNVYSVSEHVSIYHLFTLLIFSNYCTYSKTCHYTSYTKCGLL